MTNYQAIAQAVADRCVAAGRPADAVRVLAVSKTVPIEAVLQAVHEGARDFGENRPEGLAQKAEAEPDVRWHFIGNIQSRKIPTIVASASLIHSLYQTHHADAIDRAAQKLHKVQKVLIEVNVSGELSKSGVKPADAAALVRHANSLEAVEVCGLMTMAPRGDESAARASFEGLAKLRAEIAAQMPDNEASRFTELSMGMSDDWPWAVDAGATIVRIGRAIFDGEYQKELV